MMKRIAVMLLSAAIGFWVVKFFSAEVVQMTIVATLAHIFFYQSEV
jgi:hypothetical protein